MRAMIPTYMSHSPDGGVETCGELARYCGQMSTRGETRTSGADRAKAASKQKGRKS